MANPAPSAAPAAPAAAAPEAEVRVYNRSTQRTFMHGAHRLPPSSFATVPASVASIWLRQYPQEIIENETAHKEVGGVTAELNSLKLKHEAVLKEVEALRAQLAAAKGKTTPAPAKPAVVPPAPAISGHDLV